MRSVLPVEVVTRHVQQRLARAVRVLDVEARLGAAVVRVREQAVDLGLPVELEVGRFLVTPRAGRYRDIPAHHDLLA